MRILVDVDGVVADLHSGWLKRYNDEYNDNLTPDKIRKWAIHEYVKPECGRKIYAYLSDPTLYDDVSVIPDSIETLNKIRKTLGHEVVFVSSGYFPAKVKWLAKNKLAVRYPYKDGRWETVSDVVLTGNKNLIKGDILIDDYPGNLDRFDGDVLMFDQPWNWDEGKYTRVFDWKGIYKYLRDNYPKEK